MKNIIYGTTSGGGGRIDYESLRLGSKNKNRYRRIGDFVTGWSVLISKVLWGRGLDIGREETRGIVGSINGSRMEG